MLRVKLYVVTVMLGLAVLLVGACASEPTPAPAPIPPDATKPVSQEESQQIAEEFVRNSPTFAFDGIKDTLRHTESITLRCPSCWQFVFTFESRHAGYGDRTGQALAQVITPHRAVIAVVQGAITHAAMDDKWDMLVEVKIASQEESQQIAENFLRNSPTFVFDGIAETLTFNDSLQKPCPYSWEFAFEFDCKHAGYGDRTGQALAEVITRHEAAITVKQGEITGAVIDEKWDMVSQKML